MIKKILCGKLLLLFLSTLILGFFVGYYYSVTTSGYKGITITTNKVEPPRTNTEFSRNIEK